MISSRPPVRIVNEKIEISTFSTFHVKIYVIGYHDLGESILVLYFDNTKVIYSILIDSYEQGDLNIAYRLLEDNKVKLLNMVCWTHPHADHSLGLDKIASKYVRGKTRFYHPEFYYHPQVQDLIKKESATTENIYSALINSKKISKRFVPISSNGRDSTWRINIKSKLEDCTKFLDFSFLTPAAYLLDKWANKGEQLTDINLLSISFEMNLDGYVFYFGSDAKSSHINQSHKNTSELFYNTIRWLKVPHHCSDSGATLIPLLKDKLDFAASTVFFDRGLPLANIQNQYASKCIKLYMTQKEKSEYGLVYGVIEFDYQFYEDIKVDVNLYGTAYEY